MQLEGEYKNMENNEENNILTFKFIEENEEVKLNLKSPDFSEFVKMLIQNNYNVTKENIEICCDNENVDSESIKEIVIDIHQTYEAQLSLFYKNIKTDIQTHYGDDDILSNEIENYIKSTEKVNQSEAETISIEDFIE